MRVKSVADLVQLEDLPVDLFDVQILDESNKIILFDGQGGRRKHAVVHVRVRSLPVYILAEAHFLLDFVVNLEANHGVNFVDNLLVRVVVELVIVECDHDFRLVSIERLFYRSIDRKVERLDLLVQHHVLLELFEEQSFGGDVILGAPLVDFTETHFVDRLANLRLRRLQTLLLVLLEGLAHDEAHFGQHDGQLQFVVFQQDEHVAHFFPIQPLTARHRLRPLGVRRLHCSFNLLLHLFFVPSHVFFINELSHGLAEPLSLLMRRVLNILPLPLFFRLADAASRLSVEHLLVAIATDAQVALPPRSFNGGKGGTRAVRRL